MGRTGAAFVMARAAWLGIGRRTVAAVGSEAMYPFDGPSSLRIMETAAWTGLSTRAPRSIEASFPSSS